MEESMSLTGQAQGVEKLCQTAQENVQGVEELCRAVQGNVQSPENQAGTEPGIQVASENQDWTRYLAAQFGLPQKEWTQYSPLTLAYIGDAVYEIVVRTVLVKRANTQTAKLHQKASALVKAGTQAEMIKALLPHLTEEEAGAYRRGHNAKPYNTAKNASRREYLEATGFEALIGYLYLKGDYQRMIDLIKLGLEESKHAL